MHPRPLFLALILAVIGLGGVAAYQAYLLRSQQAPSQPVAITRGGVTNWSALPDQTAKPTPSPRLETEAIVVPHWINV